MVAKRQRKPWKSLN